MCRKQQTEMISIAEALDILKRNIPERSVRSVSLRESIGKYLAEDVAAPEPSPRYTNSAMDGFAVRWQDVIGSRPDAGVSLRIIGESQAGKKFDGVVGAGEAVRISTGAMLAAGSDTVIRVEDSVEHQGHITVLRIKGEGQDVRYQGEEFGLGEPVLPKATRISAPQAALLASLGIDTVKIFAPGEVSILITGSELVSSGENIGDDQIRDSNMIMLQSAVEDAGAVVKQCVRVPDNAAATREAIGGAEFQVVLCTGGVSVGRHDHVKEAAAANGFEPLFWRISQKPGKPLYFARKKDQLLFGLPGNPVSAFMCFTHYVRPLLTTLNGLTFGWPTVSGEAVDDITNLGKRTNMARVQLSWRPNGGYCITHAARQGSHMLTSLSDADGYIILEPGQTVQAGQRVDVYRYDFHREPV